MPFSIQSIGARVPGVARISSNLTPINQTKWTDLAASIVWQRLWQIAPSLWWFNTNAYGNETALLQCSLDPTWDVRQDTEGRNDSRTAQFYVWHGSQNLCHTLTVFDGAVACMIIKVVSALVMIILEYAVISSAIKSIQFYSCYVIWFWYLLVV